MNETVQQGDIVSLIDQNENSYILDTNSQTDHFKGVGVFSPQTLIGMKYGNRLTIGTKEFYILPVSLPDCLKSLKRKAQIILPKDAAHIILNCSITPGKTVLEAGIGSGALTTVLASVVAPDGIVISYDLREDFINHALKNLKKTRLDSLVKTKQKDVTMGIDERNLDAVILDIPNPWDAVSHAYNALKVGGYFCAYSPLISQVEQTVDALQQHPFINLRTFETLERDLVVKKQGTRPSFSMLGHSGYLTFARKIL